MLSEKTKIEKVSLDCNGVVTHIKDLEDYLPTLRQNRQYSITQIDYLLIGVSATGLLLLLGLLKDFKDQIHIGIWSFSIAIISYFLCILLNFLSHLFAFQSNNIEVEITKSKISKLKTFDLQRYGKFEFSFHEVQNELNRSDFMERWVNRLNIICIVLVIVGLLASITFWVGLLVEW